MKSNFDRCLAITLGYEGGFSDHPLDPGGATMRGVTQRTYDAWRLGRGVAGRSVKLIEDSEIQDIYRNGYWAVIKGDDLPAGVDLVVFDYAVNSGPNRAAKELQRVALVSMDGLIGPATHAAVALKEPADIITPYCAGRLAWLETLRAWDAFGKGWKRRVDGVEASALAMVDAPAFPAPQPIPPPRMSPVNTTGAPVGPTIGLWSLIASLFRWIFGGRNG